MENICFSILSGGKNSRIGLNKAFLEIGGITIIERMVSIAKYFPQSMIVTNEPDNYKQFNIDIFTDIYPHRGPMSGIHSSLKHSKYDNLFIISCDMPFIALSTILYIISQHNNADITVPEIGYKTYFVCGLYSKKIFDKLDSYLILGSEFPNEKNRYFALYQLEKMFKINKIKIEETLSSKNEFLNINTFEEWKSINL